MCNYCAGQGSAIKNIIQFNVYYILYSGPLLIINNNKITYQIKNYNIILYYVCTICIGIVVINSILILAHRYSKNKAQRKSCRYRHCLVIVGAHRLLT